jgi:hypothetical protein
LFPTSIQATFWLTLLNNLKGVLIHFIVPMGDVLKAFMISNVINDDNAMCAAIVTVGNGPEALLACSIPLFLERKIPERVYTFRH